MKKIILVVLLTLSVYGSDRSCKRAYENFLKQDQGFLMALERKDIFQMKVKNKMSIYYIERAIVECSHKPYLKELKELRKSCIKTDTGLKALKR